jgi:hypothetical protein
VTGVFERRVQPVEHSLLATRMQRRVVALGRARQPCRQTAGNGALAILP